MQSKHSVLPATIENPLFKDRVTFLKTAAETQGAYAQARVELAPHGGNRLHYHLTFTERFEVLEGQLLVELDGKKILLEVGQSVKIPLKTHHRFSNPGDTTVTFLTEVRPARHFEEMLRLFYGLACDGKCDPQGIPRSLWHRAILFELSETYLPGLPLSLQKGVFGGLALLANLLGVERTLRETYL
ncbi:cupin domain-containing protein [Ktedonosporobacter rubrisoli]|uniref:Cupin domain-containing protein n=1 Tax=Ktedonosporobacter rubrisoli TaxID=2509675 RepID=A0A4V0YZG9_KTERU|nr:cupin domain-containing protein [Ktedonosporobacter rubrisoli]QBD79681.1 cupin domain-containing protein [Ktedonosporobacter rubrisoli]